MTRGFRGSSLSWPGVIVGVLVGGLMTNGCKKSAGAPETSPPSDAAAGMDAGEASEDFRSEAEAAEERPVGIDDLEYQLETHEQSLIEAGIPLPELVQRRWTESGRDASPATAFETPDRCTRVCDLATTICDLATQICNLADDHDDPRYANACERATLDCERAETACEESCDG
ncbi:MAG: hypothetical protein AAF799_06015 [Myxococcota bacterium]